MHHTILTGALVGVWLQRPVGPRACSLSLAAHGNHVGVQQLAKGPQLRVDAGTVSLVIPICFVKLLKIWFDFHHVHVQTKHGIIPLLIGHLMCTCIPNTCTLQLKN
jgi:hypothetical protein